MSSPDFSRIMLRNKRSNRPTQINTPDYITLDTVKALLANELYINTNTSITIDFIKDLISSEIKLDSITYSVICLHLTIIFKTEKHVFNFLRSFLKDHGQIATELLVNFTYTDNIISPTLINNLNAMSVAILWTNNPLMVRVLYKFGADLSVININGLFAEELHTYIPYYNPFGNVIKYKTDTYDYNHIWGYRLINNFMDIINEVRIICGEIAPPIDYVFPEKSGYIQSYHNEYRLLNNTSESDSDELLENIEDTFEDAINA